MLFTLVTLNRQGQIRQFSFKILNMDTGFEFLDRITQQGDQLLRATLVEDASQLELPPEAFDGQACWPAMKQLEEDWHEQLHGPLGLNRYHGLLIRRRIDGRVKRHQVCIARLEQAVEQAQHRLDWALDNLQFEPHRGRIIMQLRNTLSRHQHALATEQASYQRFQDRLAI